VAHISGKADQIFMKILPKVHVWTRKSPLNFGHYLYPDLDSGSGPDLPLWMSSLSKCHFHTFVQSNNSQDSK